jgi:type IV fimbrial biogenesis protein FimT
MKNRAKGFTAVELMVTVAVLGVLAALAFPDMRDYLDRQRLISQMRAVSNLAQLARSEAIKRSAASGGGAVSSIAMTVNPGTPWSIGLAAGSAACTTALTCVVPEGGTNTTRWVAADECPSCTMSAPVAQAVMVFDLRGLVSGAADQSITLVSPMGKQLSLSVGRLGRISICTPGGSVKGFTSC